MTVIIATTGTVTLALMIMRILFFLSIEELRCLACSFVDIHGVAGLRSRARRHLVIFGTECSSPALRLMGLSMPQASLRLRPINSQRP